MSLAVMSACWPLQMPPTAKAVLVCMADYADDGGECWPSIPTIAVRTCFSERAVQNAIQWLEGAGVVVADRSNGRHTRYLVSPSTFQPPQQVHPRSKCTGAANDETPAAAAPHPRTSCTPPPQEVPSNRKEPPRTVNKATTKAPVDLPVWLPRDAWRDWCDHRKAIKSAMSPRAAELSIDKLAEYREQGFSPARVINNAIERGWRGLYVTGLTPDTKTPTGKPSAAADFRGKTYEATAIDDLPADLRAAALAAIAGNG